MSPQTAELGLYWKNMWYLPRQKIGPLGSFIQFLAGRRWNWGRRGSEARFFSGALSAGRFCGRSVERAAAAAEDFRNARRLGMRGSVVKMMLQENGKKITQRRGERRGARRLT